MRVLGPVVASEAVSFMHLVPFKSSPIKPFVNLEKAVYASPFTHSPVQQSKECPILVDYHPSPNSGEVLPYHWKVITTDADLSPGGVFQFLTVQGTWSLGKAKLPFDILERSTVRLTLLHCTPVLKGELNQDTVRQCHGGGLHEHERGYQESGCLEQSTLDRLMDTLSSNLCGPHPRSERLESRLFWLLSPGSMGMGPLSRCVQSHI